MPYLSIGELSARSGIATSALRYYESNGLITAERTPGGHRIYPRHMLRRLAFIAAAQHVGLTWKRLALSWQRCRRREPRQRQTGRGSPAPGYLVLKQDRRADSAE